MGDITEKGYVVKETGAVYYTQDMDNTNWISSLFIGKEWQGEDHCLIL